MEQRNPLSDVKGANMKTDKHPAPESHWFPYETALGRLVLVSNGSALTALNFPYQPDPAGRRAASALTDEAARQLAEYFAGKRRRFNLPLAPVGTAFQLAAWYALADIPYGETRSYKQQAAAVGRPTATRAVGQANNKNPLSIILPCHRVIGSDGSLTGFGGGLDLKRRLLDLEQAAD